MLPQRRFGEGQIRKKKTTREILFYKLMIRKRVRESCGASAAILNHVNLRAQWPFDLSNLRGFWDNC